MNCGHIDGTKPFLQGRGWVLCLKCANDALEEANTLVKRLIEIHDNPTYVSVWTVNQMHTGTYNGPTYEKELQALRRWFE